MLMGSNNEPDNGLPGPSLNRFTCDPNPNSASLSLPSPKLRRSVIKRVVSIPVEDSEGSRAKGASECAPPPDTWAWRKYGQKPIKGSPYPRGYYRCSSSKGCPARKQVERSQADPTTLLVTYTCDHNHQVPTPKTHSKNNKHNPNLQAAVPVKGESDSDPIIQSPPEPAKDSDKFSDLMMIMPDDLWYSDVGSTPAPADTWLYGPIFVGSAELAAEENDKIGDFNVVGGGGGDDYALFEGLELL